MGSRQQNKGSEQVNDAAEGQDQEGGAKGNVVFIQNLEAEEEQCVKQECLPIKFNNQT